LREADCDNIHYLVVAKLRETMVVSKQAAHELDGERFNHRKPGLQFWKTYVMART
jgi:hypothetical protein